MEVSERWLGSAPNVNRENEYPIENEKEGMLIHTDPEKSCRIKEKTKEIPVVAIKSEPRDYPETIDHSPGMEQEDSDGAEYTRPGWRKRSPGYLHYYYTD